jgi:hypothetical protein
MHNGQIQKGGQKLLMSHQSWASLGQMPAAPFFLQWRAGRWGGPRLLRERRIQSQWPNWSLPPDQAAGACQGADPNRQEWTEPEAERHALGRHLGSDSEVPVAGDGADHELDHGTPQSVSRVLNRDRHFMKPQASRGNPPSQTRSKQPHARRRPLRSRGGHPGRAGPDQATDPHPPALAASRPRRLT